MPGPKRDEVDRMQAGDRELGLWPRAADGSSGLRTKRRSHETPDELISGQYRLLGPIGPTTYGRAFVAEHVPQGREVALHFLPRVITSERLLTRELPLAVAKAAQLSHHNVIAVEACGRSEGREGLFYVVTEPLEGVSLADRLHASGPLGVEQALAITRQIGRALRAAHKLGIVHGELTPSNVRLVESEGREIAKVVGFGKATLIRRDDEPISDVRAVISPTYAAPELFRGSPMDERSDVYALGALLFRMIAGVAPYTGRTPIDVMDAHISAPIPSLRAVAGDRVPPEIDALVMRCMAKAPDHRYPDMVALMHAMRIAMFEESEILSRELSEMISMPPRGVNSILPRVSEELHEQPEPKPAAVEQADPREKWLWMLLGFLLALGVAHNVWAGLSAQRGHSQPTSTDPRSAP